MLRRERKEVVRERAGADLPQVLAYLRPLLYRVVDDIDQRLPYLQGRAAPQERRFDAAA